MISPERVVRDGTERFSSGISRPFFLCGRGLDLARHMKVVALSDPATNTNVRQRT